MAFLVGRVISSIPAMTAVWSIVNLSIFIAYLTLGIGEAIIFGIFYQIYSSELLQQSTTAHNIKYNKIFDFML